MASEATTQVPAEIREGHYGAKVGAIEPGGAGFIPLNERHGKPMGLFATWMSPNLEFATVFLGVIAVAFLGLSIWQAVLAAIVGNGLGALALGLLSTRGPKLGTPQMIQSRIAFGYRGNILPGGLNAVVAGIGWFAVNSVSGAFALATLTGISASITLIIVVLLQIGVAFMGHNFLQRFERIAFPFLVVAFVLAYIWVAPNANLAAAPAGAGLGVDRRCHLLWLRGRLGPLRVRLHALPTGKCQRSGHRVVRGPRRICVMHGPCIFGHARGDLAGW